MVANRIKDSLTFKLASRKTPGFTPGDCQEAMFNQIHPFPPPALLEKPPG